MRSTELASLAAALRSDPARAERVADLLESLAADMAEAEAQPVPAELRHPEVRRH
jgi:hypothetical protein